MDNSKFLEIISMTPEHRTGESQNCEAINLLEATLSVTLPKQYRNFVQEVGWLWCDGQVILGIADDNTFSTTFMTLYWRQMDLPSNFVHVPSNGVIIETYSGGGYYFLHSEQSPRAGQVSLHLSEIFGAEEETWSDFGKYLDYFVDIIAPE